jgi:hypothetical protein
MTKDEALDLALEALEVIPESGSMLGAHAEEKRVKAITAIKQALEQPVQEPFRFFYVDENGEEYFAPTTANVPDDAQPLYTTPPAQLSVPDALTLADKESPDYRDGWNDCRAETLKMRKP